MLNRKYIGYCRVSTKDQGAKRLGIKDQIADISYFVKNKKDLLHIYEEVGSGTNLHELPELQKAIKRAKDEGLILIIAKADRFRNALQALEVLETMGEGNVIFCNIPETNKLMVTVFFAMGEHEAMLTRNRTKAALNVIKKIIKECGNYVSKAGNSITTLGGGEFKPENRALGAIAVRELKEKDPRYIQAKAFSMALHSQGNTIPEIVQKMNEAGFKTRKNGDFHYMAVKRLLIDAKVIDK